MIANALLLALATPAAAPDPAPVRAALTRAAQAVELAGSCARGEDGRARADALKLETFALQAEAEGIFGRAAIADAAAMPGSGRCDAAAIEYARMRVEEAAATLAAQQARMPGLWLGTVPICGGAARPATELYDGGIYAFVVTLPEGPRRAFAAMSAARVGERVSFRLDGREILAPHMNEPITGAEVQIVGGEREAIEAARAAAARPCR